MAKKRSEEPVVRVAPLGELRAYMISEHELEKLEQGELVSDLLTIGLCLLSAAITLLATLLSASLAGTILVLFFCAMLITAIGGGICTFLGYRSRTSVKVLVGQIRRRMPGVPTVRQIIQEPTLNVPEAQPDGTSVSGGPDVTPISEVASSVHSTSPEEPREPTS